MIIAPSLLSADFTKLTEQIRAVENSKSEWLHYDVMDGHFVKNLTFGPAILSSIRKITTMYLDVHLMITDPSTYIDVFADAGADGITFHVDALNDIDQSIACIKKIKARGIDVGITIRPSTDAAIIEPLLSMVDLVLVMSVEPGFGGQSFIPSAYERIATLAKLRQQFNYTYKIEVDGGINAITAKQCIANGADVLVAGSYIFGHESIEEATNLLWNAS